MTRRTSFKFFLFLTTFSFSAAFSQYANPDTAFVRDHYTKHEYMVAMRDGVRLFTAVYTPKDSTVLHPTIMIRTPYSCAPYGENNFPTHLGEQDYYYFQRGYIKVVQDVRGRYMSEGTYEDVRPYIADKKTKKDIDETSDTYDTVDWLIKNIRGNNSKVGIKGISYPGFYSWMGTIDAHTAVKATSPQAPVSQWMGGDDWFHNGAFLESHAFSFYANFGWPRTGPTKHYPSHFKFDTPDGYQFFLQLGAIKNANTRFLHDSVDMWNNLMNHGTWDKFWQARSILPHLKNLKPATLVVGGWFDTENLYGTLHSYATAEHDNTGNSISLVIGPWAHGWWQAHNLDSLGAIKFNSNLTQFYTYNVEGPFFEHYLNKRPDPKLPEAVMFLTGTNKWKPLESWPPKNVESRSLYFGEGGSLSFEKTTNTRNEYDEYISDPAKPVPYTAEITQWYNASFMDEDQRFAARRPDVLVYQTAVLDTDITIAGPITVNLIGSTSGTDCDWIVKVIDVFPDTLQSPPGWKRTPLGGYEMLVRGDVLRGKFRNSLSNPVPFVGNEPTEVNFVLQDTFHSFLRGHRIMVQVQSTWYPMIDRNPGKFMDIYNANDSDFQKTTQRVYHSAKYSSSIKVNTWRIPPLE
jgi:putative CocE/NonD family hydrolase